jgi:hypothetical protein
MDNAAYHGHKSELLSTAAWRKEDVKRWLLTKNAPFPDDYLKWNLQHVMNSVRYEYTCSVVDKL